MNYTLTPGVVYACICDEHFLIADMIGRRKVDYIRSINETAAYFWQLLEKGLRLEQIAAQAVRDYGISELDAGEAVRAFVLSLRDAGYLTLEDDAS